MNELEYAVKTRVENARTQQEMDQIADDLYYIAVENSEGNYLDRFVAAWVNAKDTQDDRGRPMSDEAFCGMVLRGIVI